MTKNVTFLKLIALLIPFLFASCGGGYLKKANEAKAKLQYKMAGDYFTQAVKELKNDKEGQINARMEAARCYTMANEYQKELKAY